MRALPKTAVVLFNLGGPDSSAAIKPFLFNFSTDPNIIRLPAILRYPLAWTIAWRRSKKEAAASYGLIGGGSPLLENTGAQAAALEKALGENFRVFVCMRYWHPMAGEVAAQVKTYGPDRIVLLPLYPQYSTTTTRSSLRAWSRAARKAGLEAPASLVCCYPTEEGFINASAALVKDAHNEALAAAKERDLPPPRLLFSAHGLPQSIIRDGDPYQWQVEMTAEMIVRKMGLKMLDWVVCYQSRVGRLKWTQPATDAEIRHAGAEGVPLVIYPLAFTQEHVETLAEIEIEYRHLAEQCGVPLFVRVPCAGAHPDFIKGLAGLVRDALKSPGINAAGGDRLCPEGFRRCCMQEEAL